MRIFTYSEARQNFTTLLNTALKEEVIITRKDGSRFKLLPLAPAKTPPKSPLEGIKGVKAKISTRDLLELIKGKE